MLSQTTVTLIHALSRTNLIYNRKDDFPKYAQIYHYTEPRHTSVFMKNQTQLNRYLSSPDYGRKQEAGDFVNNEEV